MDRNEIPALEVGHRVFKGIPDEVKVFRIVDEYVANARYQTTLDRLEKPTTSPTMNPSAPGRRVPGTGMR